MSKQSFTANQVFVGEEAEAFLVALGEIGTDGSPRHALIFMEDREEGGRPVLYVEFNDQGNACWNGVEAIELFRDQLRIRFAAEAGMRQGDTEEPCGEALQELWVAFDVSHEQLQELNTGLNRLCSGTCAYQFPGAPPS